MRLRCTRRAFVAAGLVAWWAAPLTATADVEWCFDDPPVLVRLPSGTPVNVNLRITVPAPERAQLKATTVSTTVDSTGSTIGLSVLAPSGDAGPFPVQITASVAKYGINVSQTGNAGSPIEITLELPGN